MIHIGVIERDAAVQRRGELGGWKCKDLIMAAKMVMVCGVDEGENGDGGLGY